MPAPRPDRRVERSKRQLKHGLAQLLGEYEYDQITVQDIADRADVGRSTFYVHFESKEDLLFSGLDDHLMQLTEQIPSGLTPDEDAARFRFSLPLLRHVREHRRFFEASILGGSDSRLRQISTGILADLVIAELGRIDPSPHPAWQGAGDLDSREVRRARARAVVGAFMGLLDWWLRSASHLSAEALDGMFQRCVWGPGAQVKR